MVPPARPMSATRRTSPRRWWVRPALSTTSRWTTRCVTSSSASSVPHAPFGHRGGPGAVPDPPPVEVAGLGAQADAPEVGLLPDVDGEPAPHLRAAPPPRAPRAVAVAVRAVPLVRLTVDRERAGPAPGLFEMSLTHRARRGGGLGRLRPTARLAVGPDGRGDGVEASRRGRPRPDASSPRRARRDGRRPCRPCAGATIAWARAWS